jgi:signal transduction histidine kinase
VETAYRSPASVWARVERLVSAATRISAEHDVSRVLQEIADSARDVIRARYAAIGVLDQTRSGLSEFIASGVPLELRDRIGAPPQGHGILGVLIEDPRPLRLRDLRGHPRSYGFPPHHPSMVSFLGVPILGREGPIGNLYLTEKQGADEFSDEDESLAVMLAAHAAVAIENARTHGQRERLMAELRTLQISRDRFFSMINHELRNALTAVYGWAELLIRRAGADAPRAAREVYESSERTLALLEDLLDLSRIEAERLVPSVREVDGLQIVRESVATIEPIAERKGVTIRTTSPDGSVACRTDPQRVRQILINLLTNAVRHSPEGEAIDVRTRPTDSSIAFEVIDRGEGIQPEQQALIFEAFERAGRQNERGTGLGLAVSRKLAQLLGGTLTVESAVGQGARFTLTIPRTIPES